MALWSLLDDPAAVEAMDGGTCTRAELLRYAQNNIPEFAIMIEGSQESWITRFIQDGSVGSDDNCSTTCSIEVAIPAPDATQPPAKSPRLQPSCEDKIGGDLNNSDGEILPQK
ncbi:hypothetical protein PF004_g27061, partial [Phytophthora fragariae]